MNWDCPTERYRLADQVGPKRYNELLMEHRADCVLEVVNGYELRSVNSRFGVLTTVGSTGQARTSLVAAREYANSLPPLDRSTLLESA